MLLAQDGTENDPDNRKVQVNLLNLFPWVLFIIVVSNLTRKNIINGLWDVKKTGTDVFLNGIDFQVYLCLSIKVLINLNWGIRIISRIYSTELNVIKVEHKMNFVRYVRVSSLELFVTKLVLCFEIKIGIIVQVFGQNT